MENQEVDPDTGPQTGQLIIEAPNMENQEVDPDTGPQTVTKIEAPTDSIMRTVENVSADLDNEDNSKNLRTIGKDSSSTEDIKINTQNTHTEHKTHNTIFLHKSSSQVESRLHTENQLSSYTGNVGFWWGCHCDCDCDCHSIGKQSPNPG